MSVTLAILRGSWSMATTAAVHLSVFTEQLRLDEDGVAHVPFIYLKYIYITTYRAINT